MLILASTSPRRKEILTMMGYDFVTRAPFGEETPTPGLSPAALARNLALQKARSLPCGEQDVVLGADTVVALDGQIFGKPSDPKDANRMLRALSGREHMVYTGIALRSCQREEADTVACRVRFRPLSPGEIGAYILTGEPMDKAGAYGIQGRACSFVESISGDYYAVVGLPACRLSQMLKGFGLAPQMPPLL